MPEYVVKVKTELALFPQDLERLEDVVYDVITKEWGGSIEDAPVELIDGKFQRVGGVTDVEAIYN